MERATWNVERGMWNVERGMWNVERGDAEYRTLTISLTSSIISEKSDWRRVSDGRCPGMRCSFRAVDSTVLLGFKPRCSLYVRLAPYRCYCQ
jgi:hypothetical protein